MRQGHIFRWILGSLLTFGVLLAHEDVRAKTLNLFLSKTGGCAAQLVSGLGYGYYSSGGIWVFDCAAEHAIHGHTQSRPCNDRESAHLAQVVNASATPPHSSVETSPFQTVWTSTTTTPTMTCPSSGSAAAATWGT